eukprot:scaffold2858_cov659-Pavlova_lutheri.AAC.175
MPRVSFRPPVSSSKEGVPCRPRVIPLDKGIDRGFEKEGRDQDRYRDDGRRPSDVAMPRLSARVKRTDGAPPLEKPAAKKQNLQEPTKEARSVASDQKVFRWDDGELRPERPPPKPRVMVRSRQSMADEARKRREIPARIADELLPRRRHDSSRGWNGKKWSSMRGCTVVASSARKVRASCTAQAFRTTFGWSTAKSWASGTRNTRTK